MNDETIQTIKNRLEQLNREVNLSYLDAKNKEYLNVRIDELEHILQLIENY